MPKTILVSNRLPVRFDPETGDAERTTGGLASALSGAGVDAQWVGWPGLAAEEVEDEAALAAKMASLGMSPVSLSAAEVDGFYEGYSNGTLWPLLHHMGDRARFEEEWFQSYLSANQEFARATLAIAEEGDVVWVHDYQLFLLPGLLRDSGVALKIGFSSDILRMLPEREAVLRGILGADQIGFHTYNYLRHFRSSVLRVLGIESEVDTVRVGGRDVHLGVFPIGHDYQGFGESLRGAAFAEAYRHHAAELGDKRLVLSVERLDYTKGVPQKLAAIRRFLAEHPEQRSEVVFALVSVPSRVGIAEYDELTDRVRREVSEINGEFGTVGHSPVQFLYRGFPQPELAAFYALAEACLVTPLIDGMNLVAKEYIDCKTRAPSSRPGVLVLSEFAGAAQEMPLAILVNPHDQRETADAIAEALDMPEQQRRDRSTAMAARLRRNDASFWAKSFLTSLEDIDQRPSAEEGFASFQRVTAAILDAVNAGSAPVAIFLDYDGTLRGFTSDPDKATPDPALLPLLEKVAACPAIRLAVVSGRSADFLERHLSAPGVALIAEHGYRWRLDPAGDWEPVHDHIDTGWKSDVLPHLERAADQTPGAHVEEKISALVWHYRRADPEFGDWQARGLLEELTDVTASLPVSVHHGNKIVEVASQLVNKGAAVKALTADWDPAVVLAAGDDQTDETMFALELPQSFFPVKIGRGDTRATRRTDIAGLRTFLHSLSEQLP